MRTCASTSYECVDHDHLGKQRKDEDDKQQRGGEKTPSGQKMAERRALENFAESESMVTALPAINLGQQSGWANWILHGEAPKNKRAGL